MGGGGGRPEEMKTQFFKKTWPTPNKLLKINMTHPKTKLWVLHFYHVFPYNYAYSIEYHVQHKICTPVLISKKRSILICITVTIQYWILTRWILIQFITNDTIICHMQHTDWAKSLSLLLVSACTFAPIFSTKAKSSKSSLSSDVNCSRIF